VGQELFVVTADRSFHRVQVPTAVAAVERLTRGPASGTELLAILVGHFAVDDARASQDLQSFLTTLHECGVAVATPLSAANKDGAAAPSKAA